MERALRTARDISTTTRGKLSQPQITTRGAPTARETVEPTRSPGPGPIVVHRIASVRIRCRKSPPGSGFGPFEGQSQVPVLKFPSYGSKPKLRVTAPAGTRTPLLAITLPPRPPPGYNRPGAATVPVQRSPWRGLRCSVALRETPFPTTPVTATSTQSLQPLSSPNSQET
jgi:hypothetical protein